MNKRQKNQLIEIRKSISDLVKNYPDTRVFVKIIKSEFELKYIDMQRPLVEDYEIDEFIRTYKNKINDLYKVVK